MVSVNIELIENGYIVETADEFEIKTKYFDNPSDVLEHVKIFLRDHNEQS